MNGERLMVPTNYVGWVYVPFSSYVCNALVDGEPYTGVYGLQAVTKLMLLSGPYNSSESGASSTNSSSPSVMSSAMSRFLPVPSHWFAWR